MEHRNTSNAHEFELSADRNSANTDLHSKIIIEDILANDSNISDHNLENLTNVLSQLTTVNITDIKLLRNYLTSLNCHEQNKKYILVVKYNEQIIGTGSILLENKIIHNLGKVGHIEDIVIDKNFRGFGIATKLVEKLIEIGKNENCYKIILEASNNVRKFYEKLGFSEYSNSMKIVF